MDKVAFLCHPGGKTILETCERTLGLRREQVQSSWNVMKAHGNMSGCTNLMVMDDFRRTPTNTKYAWGLCVSFGPGLGMEGLLVRYRGEHGFNTSVPSIIALTSSPTPRSACALESRLKRVLAEELLLEEPWPASWDDTPLSDLGVSSFMIAVVEEKVGFNVEVRDNDNVTAILQRWRRARSHAAASSRLSVGPNPVADVQYHLGASNSADADDFVGYPADTAAARVTGVGLAWPRWAIGCAVYVACLAWLVFWYCAPNDQRSVVQTVKGL